MRGRAGESKELGTDTRDAGVFQRRKAFEVEAIEREPVAFVRSMEPAETIQDREVEIRDEVLPVAEELDGRWLVALEGRCGLHRGPLLDADEVQGLLESKDTQRP